MYGEEGFESEQNIMSALRQGHECEHQAFGGHGHVHSALQELQGGE